MSSLYICNYQNANVSYLKGVLLFHNVDIDELMDRCILGLSLCSRHSLDTQNRMWAFCSPFILQRYKLLVKETAHNLESIFEIILFLTISLLVSLQIETPSMSSSLSIHTSKPPSER